MKLLVENKVSHYPASDVLLKKARFLYRNQEIGWIEALAAFQEKHGDCLALMERDAAKAFREGLRPLPVDGRGIGLFANSIPEEGG